MTSVWRYITLASRYFPHYQCRSWSDSTEFCRICRGTYDCWLLCINCLSHVIWQLELYGSSSRCYGVGLQYVVLVFPDHTHFLNKQNVFFLCQCSVQWENQTYKNFQMSKVSKGAMFKNRYNQAPHLAQDTNGKVTNSQLFTTGQPFPSRWLQGTNKQTRTKA